MRLVAALLAVVSCAAAQPAQRFASLGDFKLENGQVIRNCRIGYRTFGRLNAAKSNAVLFPTWFTGTSAQLAEHVGTNRLVDPARWYVIAVDAPGNGVSSSPSNSRLQPRMQFPRFSVRDMVRAQHALVTKELGIRRLRAVLGISMGGMQAFEWAVTYPDLLELAVPVVGTTRQTTYDLLLWTAEHDAITGARDWNGGEYASQPEAALRTISAIHALALTTPQHRNRQAPAAAFPKYLAEIRAQAERGADANDRLRQLEAMMGHDVSGPYGGDMARAAARVRAKTLIVVGLQDHMVNPQPSLDFARLLGAPTLELDNDCGHQAFGCEQGRVAARVRAFLASGR